LLRCKRATPRCQREGQAEAAAYRTKVEGEAAAERDPRRASALADNPLLVELTKAENWNGQVPKTMIPGSSVPFLEVSTVP
jgi:hypothetical protein